MSVTLHCNGWGGSSTEYHRVYNIPISIYKAVKIQILSILYIYVHKGTLNTHLHEI